MPGFDVLVRAKGPLLDGATKRVVKKHLTAMKKALGDDLVDQVQQQLDRVLVNPTGHYRSQIDYTVNQGSGAVVVHDRGVVYGPWLEGTGSRNATSRFKGYATFRKIMQQAQADVDKVALEHVRATVRELS